MTHTAYHDLREAVRAELTERRLTIRAAAALINCSEKHLSAGLSPSSVRQPGLLRRLAAALGIPTPNEEAA